MRICGLAAHSAVAFNFLTVPSYGLQQQCLSALFRWQSVLAKANSPVIISTMLPNGVSSSFMVDVVAIRTDSRPWQNVRALVQLIFIQWKHVC